MHKRDEKDSTRERTTQINIFIQMFEELNTSVPYGSELQTKLYNCKIKI